MKSLKRFLIFISLTFFISCHQMTEKDRVEFSRMKKEFQRLEQEYHNLKNDTCIGMQTEQNILNEENSSTNLEVK